MRQSLKDMIEGMIATGKIKEPEMNSASIKFPKMHIKLGGVRGTEDASELIEVFEANWAQVQQKFKDMAKGEQEEMTNYFNSQIDGLSDALFGEDSEPNDLKVLI